MATLPQKTIGERATICGVGVHTGKECTLTFIPAEADAGISVVRTDLPGRPSVQLGVHFAEGLERRTALEAHGGIFVQTMEHVLAALSAMGIDNVTIEMSSSEPPIADGGALRFVEGLRNAGVIPLAKPKRILKLLEPVFHVAGATTLCAFPSDEFRVTVQIDFAHPAVGVQTYSLRVDQDTFASEIAPARSLIFAREVEGLRKSGLCLGGTIEHAVVLGEDRVLNDSLRFPDEGVRHKILDLIGDLYLLGRPLLAHVFGVRTGHAANVALVKKLVRIQERREYPAIPVKDEGQTAEAPIDIAGVQQLLPHRYPFLLVDRVIALERGKRGVGIKNVTASEPFFQGHFPGKPVMPAVLQIEAMAQMAGIVMMGAPDAAGKYGFFVGADRFRFRRAVIPGDQVKVYVNNAGGKSGLLRFECECRVDDHLVSEGALLVSLANE